MTLDGPSLPVRTFSGETVSVPVKMQRVMALALNPDAFPGGEPDVVVITMGGATVRYVRETEVR